MTDKNKKLIVVWTNLFFLVPGVVALVNGLAVYVCVIMVATVTSIIFHQRIKSRLWKLADHITANTLILSNFVLFYKSSFMSVYFVLAMLLAAIALTLYFGTSKRNYYLNHSAWHVLSAAISLFSVFGFLSSN